MKSNSERQAVLLTGASTGIGAATVALLAQHGFTTYAGVRNDADAAKAAAVHANIHPLYLDVTDATAIEAAVQTVRTRRVPLAGVVNNAGIAAGGPMEFLPLDALRREFDVNVFGAVAVTQAFLPLLRESRGRIVFVGSVSGRITPPLLGAYSSSKFALRAINDAFRLELAPAGIKVSLVEPGSVKTPIWQKGQESRSRLIEQFGEHAMQLYAAEVDALFRGLQTQARIGMPVQRVSQAILHALTASRPHAYYPLGARLVGIFNTLPVSLRDKLLRLSMR